MKVFTVQEAQGMSIQEVYVDMPYNVDNYASGHRAYNKALYTAASRARDFLYIGNIPGSSTVSDPNMMEVMNQMSTTKKLGFDFSIANLEKQKSYRDIFFEDGATVPNPVNIPTRPNSPNSGTAPGSNPTNPPPPGNNANKTTTDPDPQAQASATNPPNTSTPSNTTTTTASNTPINVIDPAEIERVEKELEDLKALRDTATEEYESKAAEIRRQLEEIQAQIDEAEGVEAPSFDIEPNIFNTFSDMITRLRNFQ